MILGECTYTFLKSMQRLPIWSVHGVWKILWDFWGRCTTPFGSSRRLEKLLVYKWMFWHMVTDKWGDVAPPPNLLGTWPGNFYQMLSSMGRCKIWKIKISHLVCKLWVGKVQKHPAKIARFKMKLLGMVTSQNFAQLSISTTEIDPKNFRSMIDYFTDQSVLYRQSVTSKVDVDPRSFEFIFDKPALPRQSKWCWNL